MLLDVTLNDGNVGGGGVQQTTSSVTVNITPTNSPPQVLNLGVAPVAFVEGGGAVLLDDGDADLQDPELDFLDDYAQSTLTITRQGGANGDDSFGFQDNNGLSLVGGNAIHKGGNSIATFTDAGGTLTVAFTNANGSTPTSVDADNVLRQVTYSNGSAIPPASAILDVTLDDGNVGGGGAQQSTASVTVNITPVNSQPQVLNLTTAPTPYIEAGAGVVLDDGDAGSRRCRARCAE